jgi:hypothetical protein
MEASRHHHEESVAMLEAHCARTADAERQAFAGS